MFGKKEGQPQVNAAEIQVETIPADFYGGQNPVIKFKRVEREVVLKEPGRPTRVEKELLDKTTTAGAKTVFHPANLLGNKKFLIIAGASLFVIFVAAAAGFYWYQSNKQNTIPPPPPIAEVQNTTLPETPITEIATTTVEMAATTTAEIEQLASPSNEEMSFPSLLLSDSADLDGDNLTDVEEELFGTDPGVSDSDVDKYNDGLEVFNLYNPAGTAPMKIIDAGLVKEFSNPSFGFTIYYPSDWALGNVDQEYRDELFSTITGENVEVRVIDKDPNKTFADWFGEWAWSEKFENYQEYTNRFNERGLMRNDGLVYFFERNDKVVAIVFHTTDSSVVNYRMVAKMMAQSIKFNDNENIIPEPIVEPDGFSNDESAVSNPTTTI